MPLKNGELSGPEIRVLIRGHNKLAQIKVPPGLDRDGLIKFLKSKKYTVDHKKKRLVDDISGGSGRGRKVTLETAKKITKPKPKTDEQKAATKAKKDMKAKATKDKEDAIKAEGVKQGAALQRVVSKRVKAKAKPKEEKSGGSSNDKEGVAVKKPKKLKGRLTKIQGQQTGKIEKETPEFNAGNKEDDNKAKKIKEDTIISYRRIKASGDKELLSQAKPILDSVKSRVRVEKDVTYMTDLTNFLNDMRKIESRIGKVKSETAPAPAQKKTKQEKVDEKRAKEQAENNKVFENKIVPLVVKDVTPVVLDWLKKAPELESTLKDKDGNQIKRTKGARKPLYIKEKEKFGKIIFGILADIYDEFNFRKPNTDQARSLLDGKLSSWGKYGGVPAAITKAKEKTGGSSNDKEGDAVKKPNEDKDLVYYIKNKKQPFPNLAYEIKHDNNSVFLDVAAGKFLVNQYESKGRTASTAVKLINKELNKNGFKLMFRGSIDGLPKLTQGAGESDSTRIRAEKLLKLFDDYRDKNNLTTAKAWKKIVALAEKFK